MTALGLDPRSRLLRALGIGVVGEHDGGAPSRELDRGAAADSGARAHDDGDGQVI